MGVTLSHKSAKFKKASSLRNNSETLKTNPFYEFNAKEGLFGKHPRGNRQTTRVIYCKNSAEEAKKMFDILTEGAKIIPKVNGNILHAELSDGTTIDLRIYYPPGHKPAVEIDTNSSKDNAGIATQKIHFIEK